MAAEWHPVLDYEAVFRLGSLYISTQKKPASAAVLAQIARLESELGLNPAARRRMYVRLPKRTALPEKRQAKDQRWERLQVVDSHPSPSRRPRVSDADPRRNLAQDEE